MELNIKDLVRKNILQLAPYASARHEFEGEADVFLDANESPFENGLNRYPDPLQQAVKAQIERIKHIPASHIFLGNGSDEVIDLLIRVFCEPRVDHIITVPPTYGMYQVSASIADVEVKQVLLTTDFQPDVEKILQTANAHSKILFLCHPNNPTGNALSSQAIMQLITDFPGIVVVDEAYIDFAKNSFLSLVPHHPNLVVMQTFSKAWGLAAIRLGMGFASLEVIHYLNKVKPPYNINILTQQAVLQAFEKEEQQQEWVKIITAERDKLTQLLPHFKFVEKVYPSDTNFLLVKVQQPDHLYQYLVEQKIIVRNRSKVPLCEGCLRITIGTKEENTRLLAALEGYQ